MNYATERLHAAAEASLAAWEAGDLFRNHLEPRREMIDELQDALHYFDAHGDKPA